ncbi:MAG: DUF1178 family protein [bacterium]
MIVYDLICENGHEFEGWFKDSTSYENQEKSGLINCAICNSNRIKRLLRGRTIKAKGISNELVPATTTENIAETPDKTKQALCDSTTIEYLKRYQQLKDYVVKNFDDVGEKFADEARKIHYGEIEKKNIRGTTTTEEEKELKAEGVQFVKFPVIKYDG